MTLKTTILEAGRRVARSEKVRKVAHTARIVAQSGPVTEVARLCGRAGVAGAVVDGSMGGMQAVKAMRDGKLDAAGAAKHVAAEAGCGFITSSAGTAGTVAVYLVTGTMGPAALVMGMGASMGSRWAYRKVVGETLPQHQEQAPYREPKKEEPAPKREEKAPAETAAKKPAETAAKKPVETAAKKPVEKPVKKEAPKNSSFEEIGPDSEEE